MGFPIIGRVIIMSELCECLKCGDVFESESLARCESCNSHNVRLILEPNQVRTGWGKQSVKNSVRRQEARNENK